MIDRDVLLRELLKRLAVHAEAAKSMDYPRIEELCWLINWAMFQAPAIVVPVARDALNPYQQQTFGPALNAANPYLQEQLNPFAQKIFGT